MSHLKLPHITVLFLFLGAGGCVTPGLWEKANSRTVSLQLLAGSIDASSIVVAYTDQSAVSTLHIPLQPNGCPASPFCYLGHKTFADEICNDVPPEQRREILQLAGEVSEGITSVEQSTMNLPTEPTASYGDVELLKRQGANGLVAIAFFWDGAHLARASERPDSSNERVRFPAKSIVLLIPAERPRPPGARGRAQLEAALITPFTLVYDGLQVGLEIPLLPFELLYVAAGGAFCP